MGWSVRIVVAKHRRETLPYRIMSVKTRVLRPLPLRTAAT
jgi:hypothetical protein